MFQIPTAPWISMERATLWPKEAQDTWSNGEAHWKIGKRGSRPYASPTAEIFFAGGPLPRGVTRGALRPLPGLSHIPTKEGRERNDRTLAASICRQHPSNLRISHTGTEGDVRAVQEAQQSKQLKQQYQTHRALAAVTTAAAGVRGTEATNTVTETATAKRPQQQKQEIQRKQQSQN